MGAAKCVHDGRAEITSDESPRSPDKKRDQEKSEPKRDATPYSWERPKPQNARIAKSKATAVHNILKNISHLPLMLRDNRRPHRFNGRVDPLGIEHGEEPALRAPLYRR